MAGYVPVVNTEVDYTLLEYIESSGTQCVDTGFKPNQGTRIVLDYQLTSTATTSSGNPFLFGAKTTSSTYAFAMFFYYTSSKKIGIDYGGASSQRKYFNGAASTSPLERHVVDFNQNTVTIDGEEVVFTEDTFSTAYNLYLFAQNTGGAIGYHTLMKLYSCQIYDYGMLVRDYVPCKLPNGEIGLIDNVSGVFYGNAGSGTFTAGPVVSEVIPPKKMMKVTGGSVVGLNGVQDIEEGHIICLDDSGTKVARNIFRIVDPVLANNTWEEIAKVSAAGKASKYWNIGDTKTEVLNGVTCTFRIIGFDHDNLTSTDAHYNDSSYNGGKNKAGITFETAAIYPGTYYMNQSDSNIDGWGVTFMRQSVMSWWKGYMPAELQNALRTVIKLFAAGGSSTTIWSEPDKLFLLSEIEVFGSISYSTAGEGSQYAFYKAGNSRVKRKGSTATAWWLRSPKEPSSGYPYYHFVNVTTSGGRTTSTSSKQLGVSFAFCI